MCRPIQQFDHGRIHGRFVGIVQTVLIDIDEDGARDARLVEQLDGDGRYVRHPSILILRDDVEEPDGSCLEVQLSLIDHGD